MSESNLKNNNLFSAVNLVEDLDNKAAETISGGTLYVVEEFTIYNETDVRIPYAVDGTQTPYPDGGSGTAWTTRGEGTIDFDYDFGLSGVQSRKYNLSDGRTYAFRYDTTTSYDQDIELYDIT